MSERDSDKGLEALAQAFRVTFSILRLVMLLLVCGFFLTGLDNLEDYEKALVLRFGAVHGDVKDEPGLVLAWPYPVDEIIKVHERPRKVVTKRFMYALTTTEAQTGVTGEIPPTLKPGVDGYLITADRNLLHAECELQYRVKNPRNYVCDFEAPELLLQRCLEDTLIRVVSQTCMDKALKSKKELTATVQDMLQKRVEALGLGVDIDEPNIQFKRPRQLQAAIDAVTQAANEARAMEKAAQSYQTNQVDVAQSQISQVKADAHAWAARKISRTEADAETFAKLEPLYRKNPEVIQQTLFQERIRKILNSVDETFIIEMRENREIRLQLPRKPRKSTQEKAGDDATEK